MSNPFGFKSAIILATESYLMLLNLHGTLGLVKTILLVVGMGLFVPLAGMVDDALNVIFHIDAVMGAHFRLPSAATQWTNTYHYFTTAGLFLTLTTERKLPLGMILAVIPPLLVWWSTRRTIMLMWAVWSIIIITLWYGETNGVNEWLYKFTVLYSFYVVYYLVLDVGQRRVQCVMGFLLLCSLLSCLRAFEHSSFIDCALKGFPVEQKNIRNDLQGRFYHPQDTIYKKMTADKEDLPCIFR